MTNTIFSKIQNIKINIKFKILKNFKINFPRMTHKSLNHIIINIVFLNTKTKIYNKIIIKKLININKITNNFKIIIFIKIKMILIKKTSWLINKNYFNNKKKKNLIMKISCYLIFNKCLKALRKISKKLINLIQKYLIPHICQ